MDSITHFVIITIIDREGLEHSVEGPTDMNMNLMEFCKALELPVEGTCGGMALCASCHAYIKTEHELPEMSEDEEDMLDQAFNVEDNSRLVCQIPITQDIQGIILELAPEAG